MRGMTFSMSDSLILPGSWSDWIRAYAKQESIHLRGSNNIVVQADRLATTCGISLEVAMAQLVWLGSVAMLNHIRPAWPSGIWQPSGVMITAIEEDSVSLDLITNAMIRAAHRLNLDPIQDTAKEGPAGLIARIERRSARWAEPIDDKSAAVEFELPTITEDDIDIDLQDKPKKTLIERLSELDTSAIPAARINNAGNIRALIYPSGRAFLSYLYDTPFFNALDELTQHGNLHVRGKQDQHRIRNLNLALYTSFYQGALANLMSDSRVQQNLLMLLRQFIVLWDTSSAFTERQSGHIGSAIGEMESSITEGLAALQGLSAPHMSIPALPRAKTKSLIHDGVGVRFVNVNRYERMSRLAIGVAFWRLCGGDSHIELTNGDYAIADAIMHSHDMGARLVEISAAKGKIGSDMMRIFCSLLDGESFSGESIAFAHTTRSGEDALNALSALSVIDADQRLMDEYRFVKGDVIQNHRERWA